MSLLSPIKSVMRFAYDAVDDRGRRRPPRRKLQHEDLVLPPSKRRKLVATTRDLQRNFSIAAWAIRKHLDYVSTFSFQCRTGNRDLDDRIESLMNWYSRPQNCDVAGRHSLPRLIRLAEERRTVDGDVMLVQMSDGRLQAIEGDRVQTPTKNTPQNFDPSQWTHGIRVTPSGRAVAYAICDRDGAGFELRSIVPAQFILHHGFFDRFDQVRGISPLASALNTFADVYESAEYALAKMKVSQLFGLKFNRQAEDPVDGAPESPNGAEFDQAAEPYQFNFRGGPQVLDLDPGDDAEFLESRTPSTEFADFMQRMVGAGLKALDIPYSFYNESFTNYSGARQALLQYEQSAACKRADVQQLLNRITAWRLGLWIDDGDLALPAGMRIGDLRWEWIPAGIPWVDPLKEAKADIAMVEAGLRSRQEIAKSRGKDWFEIADQIAIENSYLRERGIAAALPDVGPIHDPDLPDEEKQ